MSSSAANSRSTSPGAADQGGQTSSTRQRHPLLVKPLYAFQLPPTLLESIQLRSIDVEPLSAATQTTQTPTAQSTNQNGQPPAPSSSLTCGLCPACPSFPTLAHQRAHFRSDWHRYNLQLRLRSSKSAETPDFVDENQWEALLNDLGHGTDEENDHSAGTTDEENETASKQKSVDLVSMVIQKLHISSKTQRDDDITDESDEESISIDGLTSKGPGKSALLRFTTSSANDPQVDRVRLDQTQLNVYRTLFPDPASTAVTQISKKADSPSEWYHAALNALQAKSLRKSPVRGQASGWKAKRLRGMDEAASVLGVTFLEGEGYIPGLRLKLDKSSQATRASDEEDSSEEEVYSSSSSEDEGRASTNGSSLPPSIADPPLRTWTIILFGGGNFSATVVALNPYIFPRTASKNRPLAPQGSEEEIMKEERSIVVLAHKAFHRYTTRRKQGGAQSAHDASGKFAKSVGAQLRRAGEAALTEEIRALLALSGWRKLISETERVYVKANPRAARGILWTWPGASSEASASASPLEAPRADGRMRTIPCATRSKATIGECLRVFAELTRIRVTHRTDAELKEEDDAYKRSLAGNVSAREEVKKRRARERAEREEAVRKVVEREKEKKQQKAELSPEERKRRDRLVRLVDMVRRSRLEALTTHLEKYGPALLPKSGWDEASEGASEWSVDSPLPSWWRAQDASVRGDASSSAASAIPMIPSTLLHLACASASEEIIQFLLVTKRADPTVPVPPPPSSTISTEEWPLRTAYDLLLSPYPAASLPSARASRNVFRRAFAANPDWWPWSSMSQGGARVSDGPLTEEMEGNQKRRRDGLREKARAREKAREEKDAKAEAAKEEAEAQARLEKQKELAARPSHATKNRLGSSATTSSTGGGGSGSRSTASRDSTLTPEMKMRIEREKRARAAEERMKKLSSGGAGSGGQ